MTLLQQRSTSEFLLIDLIGLARTLLNSSDPVERLVLGHCLLALLLLDSSSFRLRTLLSLEHLDFVFLFYSGTDTAFFQVV